MPLIFGGQGVGIDLRGQPTEEFSLQGGQTQLIPAGAWNICMGNYCCLQILDPVQNVWQRIGDWGQQHRVQSDGVNFRVANQTGCIVGGLINAAGSVGAYTVPPTITASAGGGVFQGILGGAINTTVTVSNGGSGYTYAPFVQFTAPPYPGIPATGFCTLSAGAVSTITVVDQGAGYTSPPVVTFLNDPREGLNNIAVGSGAAAIATLGNYGGTLTGILCLDHGNPVTTTSTASLPTFTVSGTATAICIMCWTLVSFTITSNGTSGIPNTGLIYATGTGTGFTATASVLTNPSSTSNLVRTRRAFILPTSAGTITAVGTVVDGGIYSGINTSVAVFQQVSSTAPGGAVSLTAPAFGPVNDTFYLYPA